MLFFEGRFLVFLALLALLCGLVRGARGRVWLLWGASYLFYAAWDPRFLALLFGSTTLDFAVARAMPRAGRERRRLLLGLSLLGNLGALATFKYLDFGIGQLRALLGVDWPLLGLTLPVGISFYTFQSLSYTIDVYRGRLAPEPSFARFALFVSFFPQLVAGPIVRASAFLPQIGSALARFPHRLAEAGPLFSLGLFKKVVVADQLAGWADPVFAQPGAHAGIDVVWATLAFAGQIYCDFSGYTDMALALGALFGFRLPDNFRSPYLASGPQDFWRRWHISLSSWLRDYLYVPLGGSRHGRARTALALSITMLLGGLWHGAAWTFVLWGAHHAALLLAQRGLRALLPERWRRWLAPLGTLLFAALMLLGWMIFRAESLAQLGQLLAALATPGAGRTFSLGLACALAFVAGEQVLGEWARRRPEPLRRRTVLAFAAAGAALLLAVVLKPQTETPFLYFQF